MIEKQIFEKQMFGIIQKINFNKLNGKKLK